MFSSVIYLSVIWLSVIWLSVIWLSVILDTWQIADYPITSQISRRRSPMAVTLQWVSPFMGRPALAEIEA